MNFGLEFIMHLKTLKVGCNLCRGGTKRFLCHRVSETYCMNMCKVYKLCKSPSHHHIILARSVYQSKQPPSSPHKNKYTNYQQPNKINNSKCFDTVSSIYLHWICCCWWGWWWCYCSARRSDHSVISPYVLTTNPSPTQQLSNHILATLTRY